MNPLGTGPVEAAAMTLDPHILRMLQKFSERAALAVLTVGALVLAGWLLEIPVLKSIHPSLVTMKANTAIGFVLLGAALWWLQPARATQETARRYAKWCGYTLLALGVATSGEHLFDWQLGIDQALFTETTAAVATSAPGRMGLNTACNFALLGAGLLLIDAEKLAGNWPTQWLALLAGMVALLAFLGYLFGVGTLAGVQAYTKMALHTALTFLVACAALLASRPERGMIAVFASIGAGGMVARRLLWLALVIPPLLAWLRLKGQRAELYDAGIGLGLFEMANIVLFGVLIWRNASLLTQSEAARQQVSDTLAVTNTQILEGTNTLATSIGQITAGASQIAASAAETVVAITQTTTTVEEVKQTALVASQKAKSVSDVAHQAVQVSQAGKQSVDQLIEGMLQIREQMELIAEHIIRLSEQSQAIGEIIASVNDLSEQSNVLAVNAAIEAAKAGEHGKGFAVVAQEVKSLADQSKQATAQVRTILGDIQKATSSAVLATEQGAKAVEDGAEQSKEAGDAIRQLTDSIVESAQAASQIAVSAQQQLAGMEQLAQAMESIKLATTQNMDSTKQAEVAAHSLHELGQQLNDLVARYRA